MRISSPRTPCECEFESGKLPSRIKPHHIDNCGHGEAYCASGSLAPQKRRLHHRNVGRLHHRNVHYVRWHVVREGVSNAIYMPLKLRLRRLPALVSAAETGASAVNLANSAIAWSLVVHGLECFSPRFCAFVSSLSQPLIWRACTSITVSSPVSCSSMGAARTAG